MTEMIDYGYRKVQLDPEISRMNWIEYKDFVQSNPMSSEELKALQKWVASGHSVYETPEAKYVCDPVWPPRDFLMTYREEKELEEEMDGLTEEERIDYLKGYMGYTEPTEERLAEQEAKAATPKIIEDRVRRLERNMYHLWEFVWKEGLGDEAEDYVKERRDDEVPFEW